MEHTMGAGSTQAIRRLIEGSSHSFFPPTHGGNRPQRLVGIGPSPGCAPGVPVRVGYTDSIACCAAMPTTSQARFNTAMRHREIGADPSTTRLRKACGTVVHPG